MKKKSQAWKKRLRRSRRSLEKLESGELDLDESFAFYETGMKKLKHCNEEIDRVEKKMLCLNEQGELEEF